MNIKFKWPSIRNLISTITNYYEKIYYILFFTYSIHMWYFSALLNFKKNIKNIQVCHNFHVIMLLFSIIIIIKNTRHLVHWSHCCKPGQENSTCNSLYNFFKLNVNPRDVWVVWMGCTSGSWCNWELGSKSVNRLFLTGDPGHLVRVSNWVCVVSISCLSFDATKKPVSVTLSRL